MSIYTKIETELGMFKQADQNRVSENHKVDIQKYKDKIKCV